MSARIRTTAVWSRQRLAAVLGIGLVAALAVIAGLGVTLVQLVAASGDGTAAASSDDFEAGLELRDEIAAEPMAEVPQEAGFTAHPNPGCSRGLNPPVSSRDLAM